MKIKERTKINRKLISSAFYEGRVSVVNFAKKCSVSVAEARFFAVCYSYTPLGFSARQKCGNAKI